MTEIILSLLAAVLAITLHEAAHGYAALALGDDTAKSMGRLSLNPLRHVDRFGTILLPGFLVISQLLTLAKLSLVSSCEMKFGVSRLSLSSTRGSTTPFGKSG